jgi:hypothetical protein
MSIGLSSTIRNVRLQEILDAIDSGADEYDSAHLLLYSGDRPSTGEAIDEYENALLADFSLAFPCGTIVGAIFTFDDILSVVGLENGFVSWGRIVDCDGNFVMDLTATVSGGGGDIIVSALETFVGVAVNFISGVITEGNA